MIQCLGVAVILVAITKQWVKIQLVHVDWTWYSKILRADEISFAITNFTTKGLVTSWIFPTWKIAEGPYCDARLVWVSGILLVSPTRFICRCIDLWMLLISIFEPTQYASAKYDVILLATDIMNGVDQCLVAQLGLQKSPHSHRKLNKKNMLQDIMGFRLPPYVWFGTLKVCISKLKPFDEFLRYWSQHLVGPSTLVPWKPWHTQWHLHIGNQKKKDRSSKWTGIDWWRDLSTWSGFVKLYS